MFENEVLTRCAIGGTGIALGLIVCWHISPFFFFSSCRLCSWALSQTQTRPMQMDGMLNTLGIFDGAALAPAERYRDAEKNITFSEAEAVKRTGLTLEDFQGKSFLAILKRRRG